MNRMLHLLAPRWYRNPANCVRRARDGDFRLISLRKPSKWLAWPCAPPGDPTLSGGGARDPYTYIWWLRPSRDAGEYLPTCASEVGGKRVCKDRAPQLGGRFVPSVRACTQCYSYRIRDEMSALFPPLSLLGSGVFPFSLQNSSVGACLSKSEKI